MRTNTAPVNVISHAKKAPLAFVSSDVGVIQRLYYYRRVASRRVASSSLLFQVHATVRREMRVFGEISRDS